jgi:hypothetical protein
LATAPPGLIQTLLEHDERAGEIEGGSFVFDEPTEAQLRRRERLASA